MSNELGTRVHHNGCYTEPAGPPRDGYECIPRSWAEINAKTAEVARELHLADLARQMDQRPLV